MRSSPEAAADGVRACVNGCQHAVKWMASAFIRETKKMVSAWESRQSPSFEPAQSENTGSVSPLRSFGAFCCILRENQVARRRRIEWDRRSFYNPLRSARIGSRFDHGQLLPKAKCLTTCIGENSVSITVCGKIRHLQVQNGCQNNRHIRLKVRRRSSRCALG